MNKKDTKGNLKVPAYGRSAFIETVITTIVALLVLVLFYSLLSEEPNILVASVALAGMVTVAFAIIRSSFSPDKLRAQQTNKTLSLASQTLVYMRGGLSEQNCQEVCNILLPECQAMAVAMTDDKFVLGYAGAHAEAFPIGSAIHTPATHRVLASQTVEVFRSSEAFASASNPLIPAGIVAPLVVRGVSVGTLKLYYESDVLIDETQRAIAEGLAQLLSTQLSIAELDRQVELATKAELQALQAQINPHFLFNTINTIASLIRTDPTRARVLLREFAAFYRQTLENSNDLIPLDRELQQTMRYFAFEQARFGAERVRLEADIDDFGDLRVPSFIIQPIVENAVNHAMPAEGQLNIDISIEEAGDDVVITVADDGVGMSEEQARRLLQNASASEKGTGIALKNVDARLRAVFGPGSGVSVSSQIGKGTQVTLLLVGANVAEIEE
ncbi:MAG: histidine kinase [Coriobacteriaceae bacterium]|nr:histidine kinase [Coriobacteriaceae bacterium]